MHTHINSTLPQALSGAARSASRLAAICLFALALVAGCARPASVEDALAHHDYRSARTLLLPLAKQGDAVAQNRLGILHYLGLGTPVDHARAARWFKRAALAGDANAQRNLGSLFRQGLGVPRDDIRAFGWYDAARRNGHGRAEDYMQWMTQFVGWNQQSFARRIVADDLKNGKISECGEGLLMSACPPTNLP